MKAISLLQPWAQLIMMGEKKVETRSWDTKYRGPILIHASRSSKEAQELCDKSPFAAYIKHWSDLKFGFILGWCEIRGTGLTDSMAAEIMHKKNFPAGTFGDDEIHFGDYSPGRYAWLLKDAVKFETPIPWKGSLGLWNFPDQELKDRNIFNPSMMINR